MRTLPAGTMDAIFPVSARVKHVLAVYYVACVGAHTYPTVYVKPMSRAVWECFSLFSRSCISHLQRVSLVDSFTERFRRLGRMYHLTVGFQFSEEVITICFISSATVQERADGTWPKARGAIFTFCRISALPSHLERHGANKSERVFVWKMVFFQPL